MRYYWYHLVVVVVVVGIPFSKLNHTPHPQDWELQQREMLPPRAKKEPAERREVLEENVPLPEHPLPVVVVTRLVLETMLVPCLKVGRFDERMWW